MDIEDKIKELASEQSGILKSEIEINSTFDNLGFDELDVIEFVLLLEDEYDVEIEDEDYSKWIIIQDAIDYVKENV